MYYIYIYIYYILYILYIYMGLGPGRWMCPPPGGPRPRHQDPCTTSCSYPADYRPITRTRTIARSRVFFVVSRSDYSKRKISVPRTTQKQKQKP